MVAVLGIAGVATLFQALIEAASEGMIGVCYLLLGTYAHALGQEVCVLYFAMAFGICLQMVIVYLRIRRLLRRRFRHGDDPRTTAADISQQGMPR